jgi:hypothetical protein
MDAEVSNGAIQDYNNAGRKFCRNNRSHKTVFRSLQRENYFAGGKSHWGDVLMILSGKRKKCHECRVALKLSPWRTVFQKKKLRVI